MRLSDYALEAALALAMVILACMALAKHQINSRAQLRDTRLEAIRQNSEETEKRELAKEIERVQAATVNQKPIIVDQLTTTYHLFGVMPRLSQHEYWYSTGTSIGVGREGDIAPLTNGPAYVCRQPSFLEIEPRECWLVESRIRMKNPMPTLAAGLKKS